MEFKTLKHIFKHAFNFVLLSCTSFSVLANVMLVDGYVRAMPPSVPNTAAYFTLMNHGAAIKLVAVETPIAAEAQLHTLVEEDGVVKMRQQPNFAIAEHGNLNLAPSGDHIMLLGLKQPLNIGDQVDLTLTFDDGSQQLIKLRVRKQDMAQQEGDMQHHHHH
ncbi:copper chaperone PCu(A)C [Shewanella sp. Isolate11]|uniref:copper chaperone PCu(A)C n=1 Tax=Shewanella sp. Isolate11 TaxID=2908530 RepID=UPI001EFDEE8B|nr:copper chaperone PCu(A)C [Shewanella sp. Isolate11]MCG9697481.1 copper chaperone PCu(A)C [Shewanella sp. Isolate11]